MESLIKLDQYNFQVLGDTDQTLQLILFPNQTVITHLPHVFYMSKSLSIRKIKTSITSKLLRMFSNKAYFYHRLKNKKGIAEYLGLSKSTGGKIFAINPKIMDKKITVRFDLVLAYTIGIYVTDINEPNLFLRRDDWKEFYGDGILFLQTPSSLIEKKLSYDEEILVDKNSIVAFSKDVRFSDGNQNNSFYNMIMHSWKQVNIKGPGIVYLEGTN